MTGNVTSTDGVTMEGKKIFKVLRKTTMPVCLVQELIQVLSGMHTIFKEMIAIVF